MARLSRSEAPGRIGTGAPRVSYPPIWRPILGGWKVNSPRGRRICLHVLTDEHKLKVTVEPVAKKRKNPAAVALSRRAAKARMQKISPERRSEIARRAARARWGDRKKQ